jgi:hypothetical protein
MNEFYVGYLSKAPAGIARLVRRTVAFLLLGAALLAVVLARSQEGFPASAFEFAQIREFQGTLQADPYPALRVARPGAAGDAAYSQYLIVAEGKHGAEPQLARYGGMPVKLRGKLIYRDNRTMIELAPGSVTALDAAPSPPSVAIDLGTVTLTGEIVDSKCYLGVMNPGEGKVHRDCAARCLSGGIPPAFVTRDTKGKTSVYLLTDASGHALSPSWLADHAAQPITIRGRLLRSGDTLTLRAEEMN